MFFYKSWLQNRSLATTWYKFWTNLSPETSAPAVWPSLLDQPKGPNYGKTQHFARHSFLSPTCWPLLPSLLTSLCWTCGNFQSEVRLLNFGSHWCLIYPSKIHQSSVTGLYHQTTRHPTITVTTLTTLGSALRTKLHGFGRERLLARLEAITLILHLHRFEFGFFSKCWKSYWMDVYICLPGYLDQVGAISA